LKGGDFPSAHNMAYDGKMCRKTRNITLQRFYICNTTNFTVRG